MAIATRPFLSPARTAALALLLAVVAGCGGGFYVGVGDEFDDQGPDVELVASPDPVSSGGVLALRAVASDDSGEVERVEFFRVNGDELESLGEDEEAPFRLDVTAPSVSAARSVEYVAHAWDRHDHRGESPRVAVRVQP
ncbi:Ig-like domain-containing protein [Aquabacterium sp. A7-Y]|uniref:Ig-like domain-containing protein n=1 Tax=Aquabacterium sp. A7-Y TaxID=1349605 RepID=UPI00223D5CD5|nr:Ig-like domain-containing protein [Aquabacterium sp. A7-Y]MCW7538903.1 Ig-like domain-containing protein [Aquabacterium sp. A7-Y]